MAERRGSPVTAQMLRWLLTLSPFLLGLFHEWLSCAANLYLLLCLLMAWKNAGCLYVPKSAALLASTVLAISHLSCTLWAVDRGMAPLGFAKFLPLPLFVLALGQLSAKERETLWGRIPEAGAAMTALSFAMSRVNALSGFALVNHRLAGFFQYPNTFALFLLIGAALLLFDRELGRKDVALLAVLFLGVGASGSRTGFVLLCALLLTYLLYRRGARRYAAVLGTAAGVLLAGAVYVWLTGNTSSIGRYLTISLSARTFLGRLLYARDALPVILRHPLGLGYLGYYFTQGSFQTGAYSVMHVHDDLLQTLLDVGWLPAGLCVWALLRALKNPVNKSAARRAVIALVAAHSLLDFDLQYLSICFLLFLAADGGERKAARWKRPLFAALCASAAAVVCLYFGAASALHFFGMEDAACRLYPGFTVARIELLQSAPTVESMEQTADAILRYNAKASVAYSAKARAAFARGDIERMIAQKRRALALSRYRLEEYLDYFDMLRYAILLYRQNGDPASADYCLRQMEQISALLAEAERSVSPLGRRVEAPDLTLPDEYCAQLDALKKER